MMLNNLIVDLSAHGRLFILLMRNCQLTKYLN